MYGVPPKIDNDSFFDDNLRGNDPHPNGIASQAFKLVPVSSQTSTLETRELSSSEFEIKNVGS